MLNVGVMWNFRVVCEANGVSESRALASAETSRSFSIRISSSSGSKRTRCAGRTSRRWKSCGLAKCLRKNALRADSEAGRCFSLSWLQIFPQDLSPWQCPSFKSRLNLQPTMEQVALLLSLWWPLLFLPPFPCEWPSSSSSSRSCGGRSPFCPVGGSSSLPTFP